MELQKLMDNLKARKMNARYFATAEEAKQAICSELAGKKIGFGGSMTLQHMGLFEALGENNEMFWHARRPAGTLSHDEQRKIESELEVYILSANAIAETGEIINIDGAGNRVANAIYGPRTVYYICGVNKVAPDLHAAIERARMVASPPNCKRLNKKTPCVVDGKCHDCQSPERICNVMSIMMGKLSKQQNVEVILIGEELGY